MRGGRASPEEKLARSPAGSVGRTEVVPRGSVHVSALGSASLGLPKLVSLRR